MLTIQAFSFSGFSNTNMSSSYGIIFLQSKFCHKYIICIFIYIWKGLQKYLLDFHLIQFKIKISFKYISGQVFIDMFFVESHGYGYRIIMQILGAARPEEVVKTFSTVSFHFIGILLLLLFNVKLNNSSIRKTNMDIKSFSCSTKTHH